MPRHQEIREIGSCALRIGSCPFSHDAEGHMTLDAPILIRSARIDSTGQLTISVGATLVKDSDPKSEVAETAAKISGILNAFSEQPTASDTNCAVLDKILPDFSSLLTSRNRMMSPFWKQKHAQMVSERPLNITADLISAEDELSIMLAHLLSSIGVRTRLVDWEDAKSVSNEADLLILGPGPGDPRNSSDRRIARMRGLAHHQLHFGKPILGVCLGHQIIAAELGLELAPKRKVVQGSQEQVDLFGTSRTVGFYNTFTAVVPTTELPTDTRVAAMDDEIIALRGPAVGDYSSTPNLSSHSREHRSSSPPSATSSPHPAHRPGLTSPRILYPSSIARTKHFILPKKLI
ncbi:glutamine amidotransferase-related protein [Corynebacterium mastitidis]|uniref:glutamine amidotransferase-related protein n=1 Tax=Corynebacterium mastitidis TaxID=161890 RepID=UPI003CC7D4D4